MIKLFEQYKEYDQVKSWLDKMEIQNYTINDDLTVDVNGDVILDEHDLTEIPIQFGRVERYFSCSYNKLTSLKGGPVYVGFDFICHDNELTSLEYCPKEIGNSFITYNNKITSLEYAPKDLTSMISCYNNKLTSLKGCPEELTYFHCGRNNLTTLEYAPKIIRQQITYDINPLPQLLYDNNRYIKDIVKHQEEYVIWNSDGSLNEKRFNIMLEDIKNGNV